MLRYLKRAQHRVKNEKFFIHGKHYNADSALLTSAVKHAPAAG